MKKNTELTIFTILFNILLFTGFTHSKSTVIIDFGDNFYCFYWNTICDPLTNSLINHKKNEINHQALTRVTGKHSCDQSDPYLETSGKNSTCRIVVLGSSTAEGAGATPRDSSWVNRFAAYLADNPSFEVINLGKGGYTSFHILPTGTVTPGVTIDIDQERNITKALSYKPLAIIVNMPSNDAKQNFTMEQQMFNFNLIAQAAASAGVEIFFATTQPRNFNNPLQIQIQEEVRDAILAKYETNAVDFWTGIADKNGFIRVDYDSGDGVHLNNAGHKILFHRVKSLRIDQLHCNSPDHDEPINPNQQEKVIPNFNK